MKNVAYLVLHQSWQFVQVTRVVLLSGLSFGKENRIVDVGLAHRLDHKQAQYWPASQLLPEKSPRRLTRQIGDAEPELLQSRKLSLKSSDATLDF
jgi:hypothetical protein